MKNPVSFVVGSAMCLVVASAFLGCGDSGAPAGNLECNAEAVQEYLGDTCAAGLANMLTCWGASGQCEANVDLSGYDVVFDSGAVLEHNTGADGRSINARYLSPNGEVCGTFETIGDFTGTDWSIAYKTRSGDDYELRPTGSGNDYEIACANGQKVLLAGEQQALLQECAGGDAAALCTAPSLGDVDIDELADAIGKPCESNNDCPSANGLNLVCCNLYGEQICYESTICSAL